MSLTLQQLFGTHGKKLARVMGQLLPFVAMTRGQASDQARGIIDAHAQAASAELVKGSMDWTQGTTLRTFMVRGQVEASAQIKVQFGGVNSRLLTQLTIDTQRYLIPVAASPQDFYRKALRDAQGIVAAEGVKPILVQTSLTPSLIDGVMAQETSKQMSARILSDLGLEDPNDGRVLLVNGKQWNAESYADLVVRTRTQDALNQGKASEYVQNGYKLIQTSEHDVKNPDDICAFLQGKVWSLVPNDTGVPLLPEEYGLPPWHPNCAHTFAAFIPDLNGGEAAVSRAAASHDGDAEKLDAWKGDDGVYRTAKAA